MCLCGVLAHSMMIFLSMHPLQTSYLNNYVSPFDPPITGITWLPSVVVGDFSTGYDHVTWLICRNNILDFSTCVLSGGELHTGGRPGEAIGMRPGCSLLSWHVQCRC